MGEMLQVRNEYRLQQWAEIIRDCQSSGMKVKAYCEQHGVSEKSYYYYLRKIRTKAVEASGVQLIEIDPGAMEPQPDLLHIQYKHTQITVTIDVDMDAIASILKSLQSL